MGVFQGNIEAVWRSVQAFTVSRKNFVAEPLISASGADAVGRQEMLLVFNLV